MAQIAHPTGSGTGTGTETGSGTGGRTEAGARRDTIVLAIVLIAIGIVALANQVLQPTTDVGGWVVMFIGIGLVAAFLYTRQYGYLVPGGIMTGLGAGIIAEDAVVLANEDASGGTVVLGLGLGFLAIYVIAALTRSPANHWWPFIPGGILTVVGGAQVIGGQAVDLLDYWGVALIAIGVLVLARALMGRGDAT